jgi:hypothetical protein
MKHLVSCRSVGQVATEVADRICAWVQDGNDVVGVATARTPLPTCRELVRRRRRRWQGRAGHRHTRRDRLEEDDMCKDHTWNHGRFTKSRDEDDHG